MLLDQIVLFPTKGENPKNVAPIFGRDVGDGVNLRKRCGRRGDIWPIPLRSMPIRSAMRRWRASAPPLALSRAKSPALWMCISIRLFATWFATCWPRATAPGQRARQRQGQVRHLESATGGAGERGQHTAQAQVPGVSAVTYVGLGMAPSADMPA